MLMTDVYALTIRWLQWTVNIAHVNILLYTLHIIPSIDTSTRPSPTHPVLSTLYRHYCRFMYLYYIYVYVYVYTSTSII